MGQLARSRARKDGALRGIQIEWPRSESFGARAMVETIQRGRDSALCDQRIPARRRQLESVEMVIAHVCAWVRAGHNKRGFAFSFTPGFSRVIESVGGSRNRLNGFQILASRSSPGSSQV